MMLLLNEMSFTYLHQKLLLPTWTLQSVVYLSTNNRQSKEAIHTFMSWTCTQQHRSVNSSASSNNYLINVQLKCPFLLMSIRLISPAFNIHTVCIYILPTGKLLNGDSKCWTASRLHDRRWTFSLLSRPVLSFLSLFVSVYRNELIVIYLKMHLQVLGNNHAILRNRSRYNYIYDELYDKKKLDTWVLNKRGINPPFNRYNYSYENTLNMICYMLHLLD